MSGTVAEGTSFTADFLEKLEKDAQALFERFNVEEEIEAPSKFVLDEDGNSSVDVKRVGVSEELHFDGREEPPTSVVGMEQTEEKRDRKHDDDDDDDGSGGVRGDAKHSGEPLTLSRLAEDDGKQRVDKTPKDMSGSLDPHPPERRTTNAPPLRVEYFQPTYSEDEGQRQRKRNVEGIISSRESARSPSYQLRRPADGLSLRDVERVRMLDHGPPSPSSGSVRSTSSSVHSGSRHSSSSPRQPRYMEETVASSVKGIHSPKSAALADLSPSERKRGYISPSRAHGRSRSYSHSILSDYSLREDDHVPAFPVGSSRPTHIIRSVDDFSRTISPVRMSGHRRREEETPSGGDWKKKLQETNMDSPSMLKASREGIRSRPPGWRDERSPPRLLVSSSSTSVSSRDRRRKRDGDTRERKMEGEEEEGEETRKTLQDTSSLLHSSSVLHTHSSSDIVREVFGRKRKDRGETSFVESHSHDSLILSPSEKRAVESTPPPLEMRVAVSPCTIPSPKGASPEEQALYYLEYLRHGRHDVRLSAAEGLFRLCSKYSATDRVNRAVVQGVLESLVMYANQEFQFNVTALAVLDSLDPFSLEGLPLLMRILKDTDMRPLHRYVIHVLFHMGQGEGIRAVVEDEETVIDAYVLSELANLPIVLQNVVARDLTREVGTSASRETGGSGDRLGTSDPLRRMLAVRALGCLNEWALSGMSSLVDAMVTASVDRRVVVESLRRCGLEGERVLVHFATENTSHRVRAAAVHGLSLPRMLNQEVLKVRVRSLEEVIEITPNLHNVHFENISEDADEWNAPNQSISLDPREFIAGVKRRLLGSSSFGAQSGKASVDVSMSSVSTAVSPMAGGFSSGNGNASTTFVWKSGRVMLRSGGSDGESSIPTALPYSSEAMAAIVSAMEDPDVLVRIAAADAICSIGNPYAAHAVDYVAQALKDRDSKVRAHAAAALGSLASHAGVEHAKILIELLRDEFHRVRVAACKALSCFGSRSGGCFRKAVHLLGRILRDGSIPRREVAHCMVSLGHQSGGPDALMDILGTKRMQENTQVRIHAAFGLSFMDCDPDLPVEVLDRVVSVLYAASHDRVPLVRKAVLESLGVLARNMDSRVMNGDRQLTSVFLEPRSILPFFYGFLKDNDMMVGDVAGMLLACGGPHGELLLVEGVLRDSRAVIRERAAAGLVHVGPRAIRSLLLALMDQEERVQSACKKTILRFGADAIVEVALERPTRQQHSIIASIHEALGAWKTDELSELLHVVVDRLSQQGVH
eukprot:TRINITY_DN180_c0_g2_i1.p1 TRINITY_DN180_c0_g2~~TRINITY_DN180_c0_g2_i1.p1  ORF type:complete len:1266 (+),score=393.45 TRINITY_DN180_c0_g2_i1:155-3952(+)